MKRPAPGGSRARDDGRTAAMAVLAVFVAACVASLVAPQGLVKAFAVGVVAQFAVVTLAAHFMPPCRCRHCGRPAHDDDDDEGGTPSSPRHAT